MGVTTRLMDGARNAYPDGIIVEDGEVWLKNHQTGRDHHFKLGSEYPPMLPRTRCDHPGGQSSALRDRESQYRRAEKVSPDSFGRSTQVSDWGLRNCHTRSDRPADRVDQRDLNVARTLPEFCVRDSAYAPLDAADGPRIERSVLTMRNWMPSCERVQPR